MSIATSMPSSPAAFTKAAKSFSVPRSGWMVSCPPAVEPIAQGEPGSCPTAISELFGPFLNASPIGCTGGRYSTSKPISATRESDLVAVLNVPDFQVLVLLSYLAPSLRGKNSYQAPTPASVRSQLISYVSLRVSSDLIGCSAIALSSFTFNAAAKRAEGLWLWSAKTSAA